MGRRREMLAVVLGVIVMVAGELAAPVEPAAAAGMFEADDERRAANATYRLDLSVRIDRDDGGCHQFGELTVTGRALRRGTSPYPLVPPSTDGGVQSTWPRRLPVIDVETGRAMHWRCRGVDLCQSHLFPSTWFPGVDGHVAASIHVVPVSASGGPVPTGVCAGDPNHSHWRFQMDRDAGEEELCRDVFIDASHFDGTGSTGDLETRWCGKVTRVDPWPRAATVDGNTGVAPFTVTFDGTITQAASPVTTWLWDFGDGTVREGGAVVDHTYPDPGNYVVRLQVTDQAGETRWSDVTAVNVTDVPVDPVVVLDAPTEAEAGEDVTFDASDSLDGSGRTGVIAGYRWDFGDGTIVETASDQPTWTHSYADRGTYTVSVTVDTADLREDTASHTITID